MIDGHDGSLAYASVSQAAAQQIMALHSTVTTLTAQNYRSEEAKDKEGECEPDWLSAISVRHALLQAVSFSVHALHLQLLSTKKVWPSAHQAETSSSSP